MIDFKRLVKVDQQWVLGNCMTELVELGSIAFPRQVVRELADGQFPDMPGAWIAGVKSSSLRHPQPSDESVVRVLGVAAELIDINATADREVADPYIAAMAVEIMAAHIQCRVIVATEDRVDRMPVKLSLHTACERLNVETWTADGFVAWVSRERDRLASDNPYGHEWDDNHDNAHAL